MHRVVDISLSGHLEPYRLHEDAYDLLTRYLETARSRLAADPDRDEVIGDIERSIGEKLTVRLTDGKRIIDLQDATTALDEVGGVDDEAPTAPVVTPAAPGIRRRLYRIREGQEIAGVCQGLSVYSDVRVDWVRWIFVLLAIFTGGIFGLVYLAMMFILPVVQDREAYLAALRERDVRDGASIPHR